jgi:hypothetical protein
MGFRGSGVDQSVGPRVANTLAKRFVMRAERDRYTRAADSQSAVPQGNPTLVSKSNRRGPAAVSGGVRRVLEEASPARSLDIGGGGPHDGFFFLTQTVERIRHLVHLFHEFAHVYPSVLFLGHKNAVNQRR